MIFALLLEKPSRNVEKKYDGISLSSDLSAKSRIILELYALTNSLANAVVSQP